jgi:NADPH-dependent curcumin reductase CurA
VVGPSTPWWENYRCATVGAQAKEPVVENRQIVLEERPVGQVSPSTTKLVTSPVPDCGDGEALIKVGMLSIDPTIRTWMDDAPGYLPPIQIGDVVRGGGSGVIVESKTPRYSVGDVVFGMTGWQEWAIATNENRFAVLPRGLGLDLATMMNVLGITGLTAYFGLLDVGALTSGDVVVVSGAAGATGSVAGQIAKARGAGKVVGIAGGPEKCAEVVKRYGFDECLDYREEHLRKRLRAACPSGVDLYFDNVGGEILDAVLTNLAMHARIVLCGAISQYNATGPRRGIENTSTLITRRSRMEGFLILDYAARFDEARAELAPMVLSGALRHQEHVVKGLERAPEALNFLFSGENHGKTLVEVDESVLLG